MLFRSPTPVYSATDLLGKLLSKVGHLQGSAGAGQCSLGSPFWLSALESPFLLYHYGGRASWRSAVLVHSQKEPSAQESVHTFSPGCLRGFRFLFAVKVYKKVGLHASFKRNDYLEQSTVKIALQPYFQGGFKDTV